MVVKPNAPLSHGDLMQLWMAAQPSPQRLRGSPWAPVAVSNRMDFDRRSRRRAQMQGEADDRTHLRSSAPSAVLPVRAASAQPSGSKAERASTKSPPCSQ